MYNIENIINGKITAIIGVRKGSKRIKATETIYSKMGILELEKNSKAFLILQEIRNESHRFAIRAQRSKKGSKITYSKLDNIHGIGAELKRRLLIKFKSIKNIQSANIEDLMTVKGIHEKIAHNIKKNIS